MNKVFKKEQKIKFNHCDYAGIVFYPRFFEMLNELVEDWFDEELNYSFLNMHPNNGVPTVNINIDFQNPARLGDVIVKHLWIEKLSTKSVVYGFKFGLDEKVVLQGTCVLVHTLNNSAERKLSASPWPDAVTKKMEAFIKS